MKRLICAVVLALEAAAWLLPSVARAEDDRWVSITNGTDGTQYAGDMQTSVLKGRMRSLWVRQSNQRCVPSASERECTTKELWLFDCQKRRIAVPKGITINDRTGETVRSFDDRPFFKETIPDSVGEYTLREVCSIKLKK